MDETYVNKQTVVLYIQKYIHKERNTEGIYTRREIQKDIHTERHIQHENKRMEGHIHGVDIHTEETYTRRVIHTEGIYTEKNKYTEGYRHRKDIHKEGIYT